MEFQLSYFKSWKMMLWKCCTQYASKLGKLSSGHRTRKGQFSFQYTYLAVHNFLKRDWTPCIVYSFIFHLTIYLCPYMWFVIIVFLCRCGLWGSKYVCMCICVYRCLCTYVCVCVCVYVYSCSAQGYIHGSSIAELKRMAIWHICTAMYKTDNSWKPTV